MFYSWNDRSPRKLAHADPEADGKAGRYGRQGAPQDTDAGPGRPDASRILGIRPQGPARRRQPCAAGPIRPGAAAVRNSPAYSEGVLLPLRPDRRNPEGRRRSALRTDGGLEGCRTAPAGRHLPGPDRSSRRRRLLALVRVVAGTAGALPESRMSGWRRNTTLRRSPEATARL